MQLKRYSIFIWLLLCFSLAGNSQVNINGQILDGETGDFLIGANVIVKGTAIGTTADINGNFLIQVDSLPAYLQVSFIGYGRKAIEVKEASSVLSVQLEPMVFAGQEVVISASRVSETIMGSPVSVQKVSAKDIARSSSGDFYQDLGHLKGVDVTSASMGFKVINTRGFNSTSPVRSVQFIDGVDNQAPGLNFPIGNLVGASELDIDNIELISGPASALYGPNAMQGVISMTTKDPFLHKGLSAKVKAGSRNLLEGHFRYANSIDKHDRIALKFSFSQIQAEDWEADDPESNTYGDILIEDVDLSSILAEKQYDMTLTQQERDDYIALNNYFGLVSPAAAPGKINIQAPGYLEPQLADYATRSTKFGCGLFVKLGDSLVSSYEYKYGSGTAVYQGTNRYSINNIYFSQHKVELKGKRFFLRAYTTLEDAGDSYDVVFTGINLSKAAAGDYVGEYLGSYLDSTYGLKALTNGFNDAAAGWMVDSAHSYAASSANSAWYQPGTEIFDSAFNAIILNPDLQKGSKFEDASSLQHVEAQYDFNLSFAELIAGASFRRFNPNSYGTIFEDTLINAGDTLAGGMPDPEAAYVDISSFEYGGYMQLSKRFFNDQLKLSGSVRLDKSQNYSQQLSPRVSAVYSFKDHNFRIAAQSAFRSPTLQNQFLLIDLGAFKLTGNLNGSGNLAGNGPPVSFYTLESVSRFLAMYDSVDVSNNYVGEVKPELLATTTIDPLVPEQVKTIEVGYRGILGNGLYLDINGYYGVYTHFIGNMRLALPEGQAIAGQESGMDAILTDNYESYQIPVNAREEVATFGSSLGLAYYFGKGMLAKLNYTYAFLDTSNLEDPIIPGFNTPRNKFNIGLTGTNIWKGLGFAVNYKWVEQFYWESSFGDGPIPGYNLLDVQLNYEFTDMSSSFAIGASNILDNRHIEAYGAPMIGRIFYASWSFDFDDL